MSWFHESRRHRLASRGIKSGRKRAETVKLPISVTNKQFLYGDFDKDKVKNREDCFPLDKDRQHISDVAWERLEKTPLNVTDEKVEMEEYRDGIRYTLPEYYHITSKEAKEKAPKARSQVLSVIRRRPGVLNDIEQTKPKRVIYSSKPNIFKAGGFASPKGILLFSDKPFEPEETAGSFHHELKHEQQSRKHIGFWSRKKFRKLPYAKRPMEQEAFEYEYSKEKPYWEKHELTGEEITKTLKLEEE